MDLSLIPDGGLGWLDASGPNADVVVSTRIRLARNLAGETFAGRADRAGRQRVLRRVEEAWQGCEAGVGIRVLLDDLSPEERQLLHERHLISKELLASAADRPGASATAVLLGDGVGAMVNEEDHLRLQTLRSGFALAAAYSGLDRLDRALGSRLPYAFHREFGYLTACPTNAGTGLRASVLIHLPGLVHTKEIAKVLQGLAQVGLTFRGLYGEGSDVVGNLFQISNQTTLGKSEDDLLDHLGRIVRQVVVYEEQARQLLLREAPAILEDKLWRAYGTLRYARSLSFEETMNYLSGVRLGVGLNLIPGLGVYALNKLLIFTQPAHLAALEATHPHDPELRVARAAYVRRVLDEEAARG